jgi:hypothetical protein
MVWTSTVGAVLARPVVGAKNPAWTVLVGTESVGWVLLVPLLAMIEEIGRALVGRLEKEAVDGGSSRSGGVPALEGALELGRGI